MYNYIDESMCQLRLVHVEHVCAAKQIFAEQLERLVICSHKTPALS